MRLHREGALLSLALLLMVMQTQIVAEMELVLMEKSNSSFRCSGLRDEDCLIAGDMELELLMDSYISRILAGDPKGGSNSAFTGDPNKTPPCGNGKPYGECVKGKKVPDNCNTTNRGCHM